MNARFWGVEGPKDRQTGGRLRQVVAAVSGPGADPADTAGTTDCVFSEGGNVTVVTAPFATKQFKLSPPKIK